MAGKVIIQSTKKCHTVMSVSAKRTSLNEKSEKLQKLLKVVSRNGLRDVLYTLHRHPYRFTELVFETKINPRMLNKHLKALIDLNLVVKDTDEYILTENGKKLIKILEQIQYIFPKKEGRHTPPRREPLH
ncbi:winged helix-turn-helix domain-containing protein [Archaeoglobus neptunius]|uniref:winged helix-turn-helix domain-containing protein n=1 Tax=Archaeoglobus neptunius TaxID=2798580 RepID=UPI001E5912BD|nr:winged helix-turn-helix domain-containing protein [Archaeoglobus neptunius]